MLRNNHVVIARRHFLLGSASLLIAACGPKQPVKIGFIGGLSDRNADNGQSGLNAVILAVEQFNREGGLGGRMIELVSRDDAQNPETARESAEALVQAGVEAVIGPFTSGMATVIVPILGQAGIFEVSPTITSMSFHGQDDNLFRINRTTRDNARDYARMLVRLGQRRIAVAHDIRNRNFTESWLAEFRASLASTPAALVAEVPYESRSDADFAGVVSRMLKGRPDGLFFISGALAAIAASLYAPTSLVSPNMGEVMNLKVFAIIVLGGMGSFAGALLGGFLIGVVESLGGLLLGESLGQVGIFLIFILVLLLRPQGLFGARA